jgi:hypothetical protein
MDNLALTASRLSPTPLTALGFGILILKIDRSGR